MKRACIEVNTNAFGLPFVGTSSLVFAAQVIRLLKINFVQKGLFCCFCCLLFSSCSFVGINMSHKTPRFAYKFPKFTEADSLHGAISPRRACYDVTFYELFIRIQPQTKEVGGKVIMHCKALSDFEMLQVDLYPNLSFDSVLMNGKPLIFSRKHGAVFIYTPQKVAKGERLQLTMYYHGKPQVAKRPPWEGGMVWKNDKYGNTWAGVACEVAGSSLWWPSKDQLPDEPDSILSHFIVPKGLYCVSNGVMIDSTAIGDEVTYTWKVHYPINHYNFTFYLGNFAKFQRIYSSRFSNFDMDFYVLKDNYKIAQNHFLIVDSIISKFEQFYGPYPWPKDGYKLVESPYEGMEHQSAIAYGNAYKIAPWIGTDHIILHETAHEWWGNSVSASDYADVWIHEGFATYSEALFLEAAKGKDDYFKLLRFYAMLIKNKKPVIGPYAVNFWDYRDTDVYMKGALTLHTLRNSINNDSIFRDILKTFYLQNAYGIATTEAFMKLVNEKTGKDFTTFFNQYLYSRVCPILLWEFSYDQNTGKNNFYYKWGNAVEGFSIPVVIKAGERTFIVRPTNKLQRSELPYSSTIIVNTKESYIAQKRTEVFK